MQGDMLGWNPIKKDNYPDRWIHPNDSFILTVNAAEIVRSQEHSSGITLRFPRITGNPRFDKLPSQVETLQSLHHMYSLRIQQQLSDGSKLGSGTNNSSSVRCRFLNQKPKNKKTKKKPLLIVRPIPGVSVESNALSGYSFVVLEGTYSSPKKNDVRHKELESKEWLAEVQNIKNRKDVVEFIMRHGGNVELTGSIRTDFIIGGELSDPRVSSYRKAISGWEVANNRNGNHLMSKLKKQQAIPKSVLHWTFVLKMVFAWLGETRKVKLEDSIEVVAGHKGIKDGFATLSKPLRHDYLVLSKESELALLEQEDNRAISVFELETLIAPPNQCKYITSSKRNNCNSSSSKVARARSVLDDSDLWTLGGKRRKLWPFKSQADTGMAIREGRLAALAKQSHFFVLYSFRGKSESSKTTKDFTQFEHINSVVPLVEAMGADVSFEFGTATKVTHILCNIDGDIINLQNFLYAPNAENREEFLLKKQLEDIVEENFTCDPREVSLVSPAWVRRLWDRC
uniref:BRCT domain-containing protein n=2 Tax=Leptocylindrus danicus TaxID=163516 RepID=A0A7S2KBJ5_9STRA|mmetsp:Transcript_2044/g.2993  ORF Transcript_2044/g.2993 Transcript_2044/m.2993 type:complete len:512 (+) Transcript_2044:181-1716(+)